MLDGHRLVGDERRFDPDGEVCRDFLHGLGEVAAEGDDVAALAHGDGEPYAVSSVDAKHRLHGVGGTAREMRDVAEADHSSVRDEIHRQDVLLGVERARDADEDLFMSSLQDARRGHGVLGLQRGNQRGAIEPEARHLLGRELQVNALVLGSEDIDLRDIRQLKKLLSHFVDGVPQLPVREPVGGETVDDAVGIAELIVEARPDNSLRERISDVAYLLAHLVPDVGRLSGGRRILQVDEDGGLARGRVALQVVEIRGLLKLALEAVCDLLERVADRGARPRDLHHHRLDGEVRILAPSKPEVRPKAGNHYDQHEVAHEGAMPNGPLGEVEACHDAAPRMLTFWPGRSVCTPAVTTNSPVSSPLEITAAA